MSTITIRQITSRDSEHFPEALELLNRTQGRDLFKPDYLQIRTEDPYSYVLGAFQEKQLVGLGIAQVIDQFEYYKVFDSKIVAELSQKKVGSFSTLCIHESLQGKGIGQKISQLRLEWLKSQGCEVILGNSWVSGLAHTSNRVFEKMGFKPVKKVENFFVESSLKEPFDCPGCKLAPCRCAAILYRLNL